MKVIDFQLSVGHSSSAISWRVLAFFHELKLGDHNRSQNPFCRIQNIYKMLFGEGFYEWTPPQS